MSGEMFKAVGRRKFKTILLDPPWRYAMGQKTRPQHYARMTDEEIAALPLASVCHPDGANVFMWIPHALHERFWLNVWPSWKTQGLRYSSVAYTWIKIRRGLELGTRRLIDLDQDIHMGLGLTTRKNTECCYLFRKGAPGRQAFDIPEPIFEAVREHSRKPEEAYRRIENYGSAPRVEFFGRTQRKGWLVVGNESAKFDGERDEKGNSGATAG